MCGNLQFWSIFSENFTLWQSTELSRLFIFISMMELSALPRPIVEQNWWTTSIAILTSARIAGCIKQVVGISWWRNACKDEPEWKKVS